MSTLVGVVSTALLFLNTVVWAIPIYVLAVIKLCLPQGRMRRGCRNLAVGAARNWVSWNNLNFSMMATTAWDLRGVDDLRPDGSYLIVANHQSWADIVVLQKAFARRIPFLMFFIKKELVWVPVLGLAWKGLDFPFMQRSSRKFLEKHPEMRGRDLETTRALCEKLRGQPLALINFLEGTRFTKEKHAKQSSPYRLLLKPKAGGVAFVMNAIGDQLDSLLDVAIVYPHGRPTIWQFMSGRVPEVIVDVRERALPRELVEGDYNEDEAVRRGTQEWVAALWRDKDAVLASIEAERTA